MWPPQRSKPSLTGRPARALVLITCGGPLEIVGFSWLEKLGEGLFGGFQKDGDTPGARWFIWENPFFKWMPIEMDDLGIPYFRKSTFNLI